MYLYIWFDLCLSSECQYLLWQKWSILMNPLNILTGQVVDSKVQEPQHLCHVLTTGVFPVMAVSDARCYGSAVGISKKQLWALFSLDKYVLYHAQQNCNSISYHIYMWWVHWNIEVVTKSTESLMWLFTVWTCAWTLILLLRSSDTVWPPDTGTNQMILFPFYDYKVFT